MTTRHLILFILSSSLSSAFGQELQSNINDNKCQIDLKSGIYYQNFFTNKYIERTDYSYEDFNKHKYEGFYKMPAYGYQFELRLTAPLCKRFYFTTGLAFCNRKEVFQTSEDTIKRYYPSAIQGIENILKYDYTFYDIEIPVLISYKIKKINILAGIYFPVFTYVSGTFSYLTTQSSAQPVWEKSEKSLKYIEFPQMIFPSIQVSYDFAIKKLKFAPFIQLDFGSYWSLYLQGGITFNLLSFPIKKEKQ